MGDFMTEGKFAFKSAIVFLWLAVVIGLLCMFTRPVHALDSFEVDPTFIYRRQSDGLIVSTDSTWSISDTDFVGMLFSVPVPDHADGDHYSVYIRMYYTLPAGDDTLTQNLRCGPSNMVEYTTSSNIGNTVVGDLLFGLGSNMTALNYNGRFTYYGSSTCSYDLCFTRIKRSSAETYFCIQGILDFNLSNEIENIPIQLGVYFPNALSGFVVQNFYGYVYCLDTQKEEYLIDIEQAINNLDFTVDLSVLESQVAEIYNFDASFYSDLMSALENPTFSDPELTQAVQAAESLSNLIADVGSVEDAVLGTLNPDWNQFPTGVDMQNVGTYFLPFFSNPIIFALVSACLALMIVFAII